MAKASVDAQSFYSGADKLSTKFSPDFTSNPVLPRVVLGVNLSRKTAMRAWRRRESYHSGALLTRRAEPT